jgi:hypothetical protein
MKPWRLIDSGALPSSLNMGIDQALLQLYARGESPPTLRFYQWNPPGMIWRLFQTDGFRSWESKLPGAWCRLTTGSNSRRK